MLALELASYVASSALTASYSIHHPDVLVSDFQCDEILQTR